MLRYIHGSEDSLDLDVFYVFEKLPTFKECQEFCSDKEENRNVIAIENGVVVDCFKGTIDEINNGLYITYSLHKQDYENAVKKMVQRDVLIKIIRVVRCLLSHCSRTQYRELVKEALSSNSWDKKVDVLSRINFLSINDYGKTGSKQDVFKVFAFQLGQIMGLLEKEELYTKSSVAEKYVILKPFLYREKDVDVNHLQLFINRFIEVVKKLNVIEYEDYVYFEDYNKKINLKKELYIE